MHALPTTVPNVLELIGNTPMVKVNHLDTGPCELYLKLESHNPGGSIKDRIALSMIKAAEESGQLKPGGTIIEATAGNTGLGLALVAGQKGYKLILVIPDKMSQEKIFHLKAMGAEVMLTRSDVGKGHPEYYQDVAQRIANETGAFYVNQFANEANPRTHETSTGPEIWEQMDGKMDAMVVGVGSGGTLSGLGRFFKSKSPAIEMVLADPKGSILAPLHNDGVMIEPGSWLVEGIGEDFIPDILDMSLVDKAYTITDAESVAMARALLKAEGIFCGSSSGTLISAALKYCREQTTPKRVVTFVCDSGNKYLSKMFNDFWLDDQGFIAREQSGDLRDLITRPHTKRSAVTVLPSDTLQAAYRKMKMYDVSQMPVMQDGELQGIISETDILLSVMESTPPHPSARAERGIDTGIQKKMDPGVKHQDEEKKHHGFERLVKDAMARNLVTVQYKKSLEDLLPIFERGMVAIIMDGEQFLGLVTPIDLLQYLRKKAQEKKGQK